MPSQRYVFVGTYTEPIRFGTGQILEGKGQGIYIYRLDPGTGALTPAGLATGVRNPSYLTFAASGRFLYAVNELKEFEGGVGGAVRAFALDPETGGLAFLNSKPTRGTDPCHLIVDATGRWVLVANFASGSVCVLPIRPDGSLGDPSDVIQHHGTSLDPARQAGPHAHAVVQDPAGRFVFVPDLGLDKVMVYRLDGERGTLTPTALPWVEVPAGSGPRQLIFDCQGRFAYLINELNSTIIAFRYHAGEGRLEPLQTISTLPQGFAGKSTCAEVLIAPGGDWLYGSNRGHDSIVVYAINQANGRLTCVGHASAGGKTPRNFVVDPEGTFVLVANQDTDNVVVFRRDPTTGQLSATGHTAIVPTPVCVKVI